MDKTDKTLSNTFSDQPDDRFRFGIYEGDNNVRHFIRITESGPVDTPDKDITNPPKRVEEYDFNKRQWRATPGAMQRVNAGNFQFIDVGDFSREFQIAQQARHGVNDQTSDLNGEDVSP